MLFGPADRSELSLIVRPTEPSAPVFSTSPACSRAPAVAGMTWPPRSIVTAPFATLICPMSAALADAATHRANAAAEIQRRSLPRIVIGNPREARQGGDAECGRSCYPLILVVDPA